MFMADYKSNLELCSSTTNADFRWRKFFFNMYSRCYHTENVFDRPCVMSLSELPYEFLVHIA